MTRLEKKCFVFSMGMHGVLLGVLVVGSAFSEKPVMKESIPIIDFIPANIIDGANVIPGSPGAAAPQPTHTPAPVPAPQTPPAPIVKTQPAPTPRPVEPVHRPDPPKPREVEPERTERTATTAAPTPKPRTHHEIVPDFTHETSVKSNDKERSKEIEAQNARTAMRLAARRDKTIAQALEGLSHEVKTSGAKGTVVDLPGQGDGQAFVDYETAIYNAYYHAWVPPDSVADRDARTAVKIVVARDGTILSADIIKGSGEGTLDRTVDRALRMVLKLPPFPSSSHDEQRTFLIRFNLDAKEGTG